MNYALDALWWKLQTPVVRDLAAVLTAPPPWHSGCELPVRQLLGPQGFRCLLALDAEPAPLLQALAAEVPFGHRLGHYAEALLAFWLDWAPHCRLLAREWPVNDAAGRRTGALDFVAELSGTVYHLELACKYYYRTAADAPWRGLDERDTLDAKAATLQRQLALAADWPALGLSVPPTPASVLRGMLLVPPAGEALLADAGTQAHAWHGQVVVDAAGLDAVAAAVADARLVPLTRMQLLSPLRTDGEHSITLAQADGLGHRWWAVVQERPDGAWHEVLRVLVAAETPVQAA